MLFSDGISSKLFALNNKTKNKKPSRSGLLIGLAVAGFAAVVAIALLKHHAEPAQPNESAVSSTSPDNGEIATRAAAKGAGETAKSGAKVAAPAAGSVSELAAQLNAQLKQPNISPEEQKKAIVALAKTCSSQALGALQAVFADGSPDIRRMIAEGLGACSSPEASNLLISLLKDPDETIAGAAIRGLVQQGSAEAVAALTELLNNTDASPNLRADAALGLGEINQPGIVDMLAQAARQIQDEDIVSAVLHALGGRDFSETQAFFQTYLHSPDISSDLRVAAVEALSSAKGDPSAFLAELAADSDSDVRVAVGWALSATEETGNVAAQLVALLQSETDPDVRLRFYEALRNQDDVDASTVLGLVQNEKDPSALVAGLDLLAKLVRDTPSPELQKYFVDVAIPELKQIALTPNNFDNRQAAILALTRSRLPDAQAAVADIGTQLAQNPPPQSGPQKKQQ
jgi:HEAT repeat protein